MRLLGKNRSKRASIAKAAPLLASLVATSLVLGGFARSAAQKDRPRRLQGQVPIEDQQSGRSLRPYTDNMRLVGQNDIQNRGMNGNLGWIDDCAYVAAYFGADDPLAGLAVVDASNPRKPQLTEVLPGTPGTRESQVEANEARDMVIVMPFSRGSPFGDPPGPTLLQIYRAAENDCTDLTLMGVYDFGDIITHEHRISEDGNTVYATVNMGSVEGDALQVVDVTDMANPTLLTTWDLTHEPGRSGLTTTTISRSGRERRWDAGLPQLPICRRGYNLRGPRHCRYHGGRSTPFGSTDPPDQ